jgi:transcriptional regulator with XRE-family HTH domain
MHRVPDSQIVVKLLGRSRLALKITQKELADLLGVARRTISRWESRAGVPSPEQLRGLARAVHPHDAALAAELAAEGDATLEALGLRPQALPAPGAPGAPSHAPAPASGGLPSRPFPPVGLLIDSIVHVAARALDGQDPSRDPIGAVTTVLRVAFARASALGLTVGEVERALSPRAEAAAAETQPTPKRDVARASR